MGLNDILENEELRELLNKSIEKTYYKYKLSFIIEKEDFEQETYIFIIPRIKNFDDMKSSLKTYLPLLVMTSAKRCIQSANGQSKSYNKLEFKNSTMSLNYEYEQEEDNSMFLGDMVSNNIEDVDIKLLVNEIISMKCLSEKQRQIIMLMSKGYTISDIAKMLNQSTSSVNITFHRAKEKIVRKYA